MAERRLARVLPRPTRTKVVATLGPASHDPRVIRRLIRAGADVFRLNFSHGDHEQHQSTIRAVREAARREDRPIGVLADLQGPRIRVGALKDDEPILLKRGQDLVVVADPDLRGGPGRIGCSYRKLAREVRPGEKILLDDGNLELLVERIEGSEVYTRVMVGGLLRPHKGINLPATAMSAPSLTAKDLKDLRFALEHEVDLVALSFVRTGEDVRALRRRIRKAGSDAEVIAKVERRDAVRNIDEIVREADGVMVARGDLGVELGPAAVPPLQKKIIERCIAAAKPVITATQMLESMVQNARPTRAEASDVANAIYDGTSALMLSAETATGRHPELVVRTMERIAKRTERALFESDRARVSHHGRLAGSLSISEATVVAAAHAATRSGARAVVTFTETGRTAKLVARERLPLRLYACTPSLGTYRRLALHWGIIPILNESAPDADRLRASAEEALLAGKHLRPGDRVVFIAGTVHVSGATNTVSIVDVGTVKRR